jgi:hypothetical protein
VTLYFVKVSSFVGWSIGAKHYWATIDRQGPPYENSQVYSNESKRYTSSKSAVNDAKNWFRRERLKGCLLLGSTAVCDPQKVLIAPRVLKTKANALNRRADACGRYEGDEVAMDKIYKEWEALWAGQTRIESKALKPRKK